MNQAKFLSPLVAQKLPDNSYRQKGFWNWLKRILDIANPIWELQAPLVFYSAILKRTIVVPRYYLTDFASVPRVPLVYLVAGSLAHEAAVIHDFLYQTHLCDRATADRIFREAMGATHVVEWKREVMFGAVRTCGYFSYKSGPKRFKVMGNHNRVT